MGGRNDGGTAAGKVLKSCTFLNSLILQEMEFYGVYRVKVVSVYSVSGFGFQEVEYVLNIRCCMKMVL